MLTLLLWTYLMSQQGRWVIILIFQRRRKKGPNANNSASWEAKPLVQSVQRLPLSFSLSLACKALGENIVDGLHGQSDSTRPRRHTAHNESELVHVSPLSHSRPTWFYYILGTGDSTDHRLVPHPGSPCGLLLSLTRDILLAANSLEDVVLPKAI